jgi:hypothetical protein
MEALNSMVALAEKCGLFAPIRSPAVRRRMSLYADDLVVFVVHVNQDVMLLHALLDVFMVASCLQTNISKC